MVSKLSSKAYLTEVTLPRPQPGKPKAPISVRLDLMFPLTVDARRVGSTLYHLLDGKPVQITIERIEE